MLMAFWWHPVCAKVCICTNCCHLCINMTTFWQLTTFWWLLTFFDNFSMIYWQLDVFFNDFVTEFRRHLDKFLTTFKVVICANVSLCVKSRKFFKLLPKYCQNIVKILSKCHQIVISFWCSELAKIFARQEIFLLHYNNSFCWLFWDEAYIFPI